MMFLTKEKASKSLHCQKKSFQIKTFGADVLNISIQTPTRSICPTVLKTTKPSSNWSASVKAEKDRTDLFDDIALLITIKLLIAYFPAEGC